MKERAVFFDIGNVLLNFDVHEVGRRFENATGVGSRELFKVFKEGDLNPKIERGEITCVALYEHLKKELGVDLALDAFHKMFNEIFTENTEVVRLFRRLQERHKVYLLSNTNHWHFEHIQERYAWANEADGHVVSYKVGARKPEPEIYHAALEMSRLPGEDCVFFDDLQENVEAARDAGLRAHLFAGVSRMQEDLFRLGYLS